MQNLDRYGQNRRQQPGPLQATIRRPRPHGCPRHRHPPHVERLRLRRRPARPRPRLLQQRPRARLQHGSR
ncbi:hypothetical protein EMCG_03266 [[Emmonsia] crescens]|uniref:Uncharacterized protein n=1 Tax=[Emmonsia] crescens TaxID=73230 RepID=A0A0G2HW84_9EURO|nr:hypothetical protein EMCG_03266 [Emmonsia crescens UAMH 3008]